MLVQLRRVVYLLVLLQCSLSVSAEKAYDPETDAIFTLARWELKESIFHVKELIAKQAVCLEAWDKSRKDYVKKIGEAKEKGKGIDARLEKIEVKAKARFEALEEDKVSREEALNKTVEEAWDAMLNTKDAVDGAITSLAWADYVRDICRWLSHSMANEEGHFRRHVDVFRGFLPNVTENTTKKISQLAEKGDEVLWELSEKRDDFKKAESDLEEMMAAAATWVREVGKEVIKAEATFDAIPTVYVVFRNTSQITAQADSFWERISKKIKEKEAEKQKVLEELTDTSFLGELKATKGNITEEEKMRLTKAMEAKAQPVVEERTEAEEAEKTRKAQEQASREAGKKARVPEEETEKVKEDGKTGTTAEEEKRAEGKAKEDAKGLAEEAEKRTKELEENRKNAKKEKDSSIGPALLHSPLLLLLLCVLGSILVC